MFIHIECPSCQTLGQFSALDGNYSGPYRCWQCKALYSVEIEDGEMISCKPMTESELEELKAKQEAMKKNPDARPQTAPKAPKTPKEPSQSSFVWPKIPDNPPPHSDQPSILPKTPENKPTPPANPANPKAPFIWPPLPKRLDPNQ
ncbi:MAG: hypothetical protein PHN78_08275 [Dehalococcoidales bacterium]|nr:hypothetical protein [Dehalococcoidales bacterium]